MRLTIVGNGVAGSSLARLAREEGHSVRLISQGKPSASLAALAVLRKSYVGSSPDGSQAVDYALERYRAAGCEVLDGALVTGPKYRDRPEEDWHAVDPSGWLLAPDVAWTTRPAGWADPESDVTVHSTGEGLDGDRVWGCTWFHADPKALDSDSLRVLRYAPYRTVDAVSYASGCRLGSSTGKTREAAQAMARRQFLLAGEAGWILDAEGWLLLTGCRVRRSVDVVWLGDNVVEFGGFHRSGWSVAPWRAKVLLDSLK